jgi:hypothetical protein
MEAAKVSKVLKHRELDVGMQDTSSAHTSSWCQHPKVGEQQRYVPVTAPSLQKTINICVRCCVTC